MKYSRTIKKISKRTGEFSSDIHKINKTTTSVVTENLIGTIHKDRLLHYAISKHTRQVSKDRFTEMVRFSRHMAEG